ncbi:ABC transporter [Haloprofundus marisrubri]|uniref:Molybdate/tungstate import ATP-binding protein WtpC n=1 Tax=Haloprofundus marisrubri TaxID=1514971 RepID=A0A0W1RCE4_9EURY|nr:ABC transporter ATP-binding protein [Haloprofundus marisrubri]KTG11381.1 ABC transporter [Haloprofundus marisrubri]
MTTNTIEFDDVTKVYGDDMVAIEDVTYGVEKGTTTVLVGPSGCGKTTTMELVNRLEDPTEGTVYYEGTDIQELDRIQLRREIGYVIQEIGLFDHMTVGENVATVPELKGWDRDRINDRIDELLDLMDLPPTEYRDQYPRSLSGGQRQRVGIARALAGDPDVLLMDEPFGALDPITRETLQNEFLEIQEKINTTILFVTHSIDEALKMGDKIAIYDVGEVVQYGTPQEILESPANNFVEDFVGADRGLKRLQVTQVKELLAAPVKEAESGGRGVAVATDGNGSHELSPTDSAQVALSRMIQYDVETLPVTDDGRVVGEIEKSDIHQIARTEG